MLSSPAAQHSRMPSSFTSRRRNQLALIFSALIFVVIGIGIFIGARRSLADAALVSHTHEVIGRVDEIQARVLDAESAQRGFLLTGNDAYLLDYQTSVQRLPILLDNPRRLIVDNPAQEQHLTQLQRLVETRLQQIQHVDWSRHVPTSGKAPSVLSARSASRHWSLPRLAWPASRPMANKVRA